jgi:formylglycine-generating enzyme required for sulfatase activity
MTTTGFENRNYIKIQTPGVPSSTPAIYGWDLNNNGTLDEAADGGDVACNYLDWADLLAYLDWAALRPMTELEYEKVARGAGNAPTNDEYPWGSTTINQAVSTSLTTAGQSTEVSTSVLDGLCAYIGGASNTLGPLRVGFASTAASSRTNAGAGFYGAMDLGGNVFEQCMMAGYYTGAVGRMVSPIFTNQDGDGMLDGNGNANQSTWLGGPSISIVRGGNWEYGGQGIQTSTRLYPGTTVENAVRTRRVGGRGVR